MTDIVTRDHLQTIALLCIGDVSSADGGVALPLAPLFGQPLIHHMIKALQKIGIQRFCIGVDTVPGALLSYRDFMAKDGLDIRFVREPAAIAAWLDRDTRALVLRADTIWDIELIARALQQNDALVATVEERDENQVFERIDLNNRWAGMAVLERRSLEALTQLPEGWDMASALLRQALQDGVTLWPLKQSEIQDGHVRRLDNLADLAAAQSVLMATPEGKSNTLESKLFSASLKRIAPAIWSVSGGRGLSEYSFPGLSFIAALMAILGFPVGAMFTGVLAVLASLMRNIVRSAEYRDVEQDWLGPAGWALLAAALVGVVKFTEPSLFEAGFLGLALSGLSLSSTRQHNDQNFRWLSPLVIGLAVMAGTILGSAGWAIKLLIMSEIVLQVLRRSGMLRDPKRQD